jgi:hypothetical protein
MSRRQKIITASALLNLPLIIYLLVTQISAAAGSHIHYTEGPTHIIMTPTFDWVTTLAWLVTVIILGIPAVTRPSKIPPILIILFSLFYLFALKGYATGDYTDYLLIHPKGFSYPDGTLIYMPTRPWHSDAFLSRLRLDYSFTAAVLLGSV